ncbi:YoaK family protein [Tardiphaga sp. 768_D3_N2_1]|uniref:YoaK family protein n=1 Tax=Tardiphaga sp. 768_D3_N2_1 TaxID=3240783 RepID=UPI003F8C2C68
MWFNMYVAHVGNPPMRREESLLVALLLGFAGGYLDAYTWITHGVLANAQTANLVFLWVNAMVGKWEEAFHFVPSLFAFMVGVVLAAWLRRIAGDRAGPISILVEIAVLVLVGVLHNRMPDIAGTLGVSMVAAMQTSVFNKVEGANYSSVMITGNLRQAIDGVFALVVGDSQVGLLRKSCIFIGVCAAFGTGAAVGAFITERTPAVALTVPVAALLLVLLRCGRIRTAHSGWR